MILPLYYDSVTKHLADSLTHVTAFEGGFVEGNITGLPSSVCVVDGAINGFIDDQISLSKGDALGF